MFDVWKGKKKKSKIIKVFKGTCKYLNKVETSENL